MINDPSSHVIGNLGMVLSLRPVKDMCPPAIGCSRHLVITAAQ